ncbi:hypothetical protein NIES4072_04040 [Nostoc commune NIES-4072]|uniref:Uncharacterized protein n=1 Tax=Nostoc commune NIES-4072 TaxID=2005467 RepID=A0A2R5FHF2_NOSCO|nr:hypothetical protein NIES4070_22780 [Nostoc commune HK-02]GBG16758.1 hypothetical protein NIES4072_04040 [Nostoc commune NIES-4072]
MNFELTPVQTRLIALVQTRLIASPNSLLASDATRYTF